MTPGAPRQQPVRASVDVAASEAADTLYFLGAYASAQSACELLASRYFSEKAPALMPLLQSRVLARLTDRERIDLVDTLGQHSGYSGMAAPLRPTFYRVKHLRDAIAHSPRATWRRDVKGVSLNVVLTWDAKRRASPPPRVTPVYVLGASDDCAWFEQHVMRLGWEAGLFDTRTLDGIPFEPPLPSSAPPRVSPRDD